MKVKFILFKRTTKLTYEFNGDIFGELLVTGKIRSFGSNILWNRKSLTVLFADYRFHIMCLELSRISVERKKK